MTDPTTVLVTGATGFIGRRLVPELVERGMTVRAMTRRPEAYDGPGEPVGADVHDADSLTDALKGVDVAIYLVHSLDDPDFERKDAEAARTFGPPPRPGWQQIVYMGGLGADNENLSPTCARAAGGGPARRGRGPGHRAAGRDRRRCGRHLLGADAPAGQEPAGDGPAWVSTMTQPIAVDDVIRYLAGSSARRRPSAGCSRSAGRTG